MIGSPSRQEFTDRITRLFEALTTAGQPFDTALIFSRINQYYLTGTMQDGLLVLRRDGSVTHFIRKSFERARLESPLDNIVKMTSYRDMRACLPANLGSTWLETEIVPLSTIERLQKHFQLDAIRSVDQIIAGLRTIKSAFELALIAESGRQHAELIRSVIPSLLYEGMSETDLTADLYAAMVKQGHHGVSRFSMFQMEMIVGQLAFGTNSLYPTSFDGPGGMRGMSPAVPLVGDRHNFLQRGDIVFVDVGYGIDGYHSDKTQVYSFGRDPDPSVLAVHRACKDVLDRIAGLLTVGRIPADIYTVVMADLPSELNRHFMGFGDETVRFLGHGVGLTIDEIPVIASGFRQPLAAGMVIALEPKCGIEGVGMVGVEETYAVTKSGPVCLTGGAQDIIVVPVRSSKGC